ncbi:hypothetical protein [Saccharothrix obliqua]|uniref:hypothetical protein n=1 Tax=Saccharothrix obliqua TaxID=2861747 RepID=UPI001C5D3D7A|nr:hypothetical protein [Saccharothrix obliqua]MBW4718342.1 hypothetical protein [Saccharothrix obliqua]
MVALVLAYLGANAIGVYRSVTHVRERPDVPAAELLLDVGPRWTLVGLLPPLDERGRPRPGVVAGWADGPDRLVHTVLKHVSPARAELAHVLARPSRGEAVAGWGRGGDRASVACVDRTPPDCRVWVYETRYGQYTERLLRSSPDGPVEEGEFLALAREVDVRAEYVLRG